MTAGNGCARPHRLRFTDFSGREFSLSGGPHAWEHLGGQPGSSVLLLGLGPAGGEDCPAVAAARQGGAEVCWLDEESTLRGLRAAGGKLPAPGMRRVDAAMAVELARVCATYFYRPGMRIAPHFWGPLLGAIDAAGNSWLPPPPNGGGKAWLPGNPALLLHRELKLALAARGLEAIESDVDLSPGRAARIFGGEKPLLGICVNMRGLDAEGRIFNLFRELGIPLALWFVDNPWHILSGIRLPWWKQAAIFVSDRTFLPGLMEQGAQKAEFLPLAMAQHMDVDGGAAGSGQPVFVGRSAFPQKESFFAAARLPEQLLEKAGRLQACGAELPDFHWWQRALGVELWPGQGVRCAGLGAEECSRINRTRWLAAGLGSGLRIIGDSGWKSLLPGAKILPPVDYYGSLPQIYATAKAVLNVTSLLMPGSLNQRHFDVWAAGGLLLSQKSAGLELFPEEMVRPVCLDDAGMFAERLAFFDARPAFRRELARAWGDEIRSRHTYGHRVERILRSLDLA